MVAKRFFAFTLFILAFYLISESLIAQEGKIVRIKVHSPSLEGNLFKDSPDRDVTIYLPPSYDIETEMRYPVVYLLPGWSGTNELWTGGGYVKDGNIVESMKSWLNNGKVKELIIVIPNTRKADQGLVT